MHGTCLRVMRQLTKVGRGRVKRHRGFDERVSGTAELRLKNVTIKTFLPDPGVHHTSCVLYLALAIAVVKGASGRTVMCCDPYWLQSLVSCESRIAFETC